MNLGLALTSAVTLAFLRPKHDRNKQCAIEPPPTRPASPGPARPPSSGSCVPHCEKASFSSRKKIHEKKRLDLPGFEPGAFRMQSGRATTALYSRRDCEKPNTALQEESAGWGRQRVRTPPFGNMHMHSRHTAAPTVSAPPPPQRAQREGRRGHAAACPVRVHAFIQCHGRLGVRVTRWWP